jgi:uncharacterized SAM-binding protein YcdF (DUF218 family)
MDEHIRDLAEKIWHYHQMNHQLAPSDVILVLCSHDKKVAERGAQLWLEGWAPWLIFSGGLGVITSRMWNVPEAEQFAEIAMSLGVPSEKILVENKSTNTGENVLFTRRLVEQKKIAADKFIVVQKPYMERRSFATFKQVWPEKQVLVTSPRVSFAEYLASYSNSELTGDDVVCIMVGDLQRIKVYADKGWQIPQEVPNDIWSAYDELVKSGYDRHLIASD